MWSRMNAISHISPEMNSRLEGIVQSMTKSATPNTIRAYSSCFRRFKDFVESLDMRIEDTTSAELVFYLQGMIEEGKAASTISQTVAAISWHFLIADRPDPTKHKIVTQMVAAARKLGPPVKHKEAAQKRHLQKLLEFREQKGTFTSQRTFLIGLASYAGVCRADDILDLQIKHISIKDHMVRLDIPHTKTDRMRQGNSKYMARATDPKLCPVRNFRLWLDRAEVGKRDTDALFPAKFDPIQPISYTTYSENLAEASKGGGLPRVTPHGFRAGGASAMIEHGATMDQVQLAGSWQDPKSTQVYVERSESL